MSQFIEQHRVVDVLITKVVTMVSVNMLLFRFGTISDDTFEKKTNNFSPFLP